MGDTIWVDTEGRQAGDLPDDNSILLRLKDELDNLSDRLRVARLSSFYDYSELEASYLEPAQDNDASEGRQEKSKGTWRDPAPALAALRTIREHLGQHPDDLPVPSDPGRKHWRAGLMKELERCSQTLDRAAAQGRKFRLLIVP